jgi:hypothetical protein
MKDLHLKPIQYALAHFGLNHIPVHDLDLLEVMHEYSEASEHMAKLHNVD